ncbi:vegetative incompatibility protein 4 [Xylariaceae sp. FL1019]|nr:vegetative incompatibility protein 4 [Xylariaceae sp. FL1019]
MANDEPQLQAEFKEKLMALSRSDCGEIPLDDAILKALPRGTKVQSAHRHGVSGSAFTAKINAVGSHGSPTPFFLKYVAGETGKDQLRGEYTGMMKLHEVAPDLVPKPIAWGKLKKAVPAAYFILIEFKHFAPGLPDPAKLGIRLAAMHEKSAVPGGNFGFHMQTYDGARIQAIGWDSSWTSFFSKLLAEAHRQDAATNGAWHELDIVFERAQSHLIPRLIGAVEADGRKVTPVVIHGDLWDGNVANDSNSGDPWIFDCAAYYAHHEMELGIWRAERHQLRAEVFRKAYFKNMEPSEPQEEADDRNRLYSVKTNLMHSACISGSPARRLAVNDMFELIQKYVPWNGASPEYAMVRKCAG